MSHYHIHVHILYPVAIAGPSTYVNNASRKTNGIVRREIILLSRARTERAKGGSQGGPQDGQRVGITGIKTLE